MARMLSERDSTAFHLNGARRHVRLLRRYRRDVLVRPIEALIKDLGEKANVSEEAEFESQAAYDAVLAADGDLDDAVRNVFDAGKIYDRANPDSAVLPDLFPDGGFGAIIELNVAKEPDAVDALATKVVTLGDSHPLFSQVALLRAAAQGVRDALKTYEGAVGAQKSAEAQEEIAKSALRRKYEANALDARKQWGRVFADRLFPNLRPTKRAAAGGDKVVKAKFAEKSA